MSREEGVPLNLIENDTEHVSAFSFSEVMDLIDSENSLNPEEEKTPYDELVASAREITELPEAPIVSELSFEEKVEFLKTTVTRNPLQREINYKTLKFCCEGHTLSEVEEFIASCPEFEAAVQSPYYLLQFLLKGGGIDTFELDHEGEIVLPEQKEGLDEDQLDDLVAELAFETNEIGREVVELMSPQNRLLELLDIVPDYYDTFIEVLDFLTEKRSMAHVDTLLRGRDVLMAGRDPGDRPVQPSIFIDKLEKAGGIYWENGWLITKEGKDVLEILEKRRGE